MTQQVIDSDQIETMIGEIVSSVTGEPVACRLETVRITDGTYYLQWHVKIIAQRIHIHQTLGVSFTMEAFDLERLRKHITAISGQLRVKLLANVAEGN